MMRMADKLRRLGVIAAVSVAAAFITACSGNVNDSSVTTETSINDNVEVTSSGQNETYTYATETAGTEEETTSLNALNSSDSDDSKRDEYKSSEEETTVAQSQETSEAEEVTSAAVEAVTQAKTWVICLDPGHGGESQGTHYIYDEKEIEEKTLNYYIAKRLKVYLEQYDNVEVVIDRPENADPSFEERVAVAKKYNADFIISIHNNSKSRDDIEPSGCMAITTCSRYQAASAVNDDIYGASRKMALSMLSSLGQVGLSITIDWDVDKTDGILQRVGAGTYPDGSASDYYGLIRNATNAGIPSVIIEHAFLSNESDYRRFLSDNSKLDALAKADAKGIMSYLSSLQ